MMDIKDQWQVCSLELSMRLKELGYPQKESLWYWQYNGKEGKRLGIGKYKLIAMDGAFGISKRDCVAPTAAEIGMALPYPIDFYNKIEGQGYRVGVDMGMLEYVLTGRSEGKYNPINFYADTEANARGLMWEYLKKNGLLKEKNG